MNNIADVIQDHIDKENEEKVLSPAIGGGKLFMKDREWEVWIVNRYDRGTYLLQRDFYGGVVTTVDTGKKESLRGKNNVAVCKNSFIGRTLLYQCFGDFLNIKAKPRPIKGEVLYSFRYTRTVNSANDIHFGNEILHKYEEFTDLSQLREEYEKLVGDYTLKVNQKEALKEKQQKEEEAERIAIQRAKDEAERKRLEEEQKKAEAARLEAIKEAEEEQRIAEQKRDEFLAEHRRQMEQYANAVSFIRKNAELRNNPILDKMQDKVKFCHLFDNVTAVIDGGPGTGKTTTMIQRLKFLICKDDLMDHMKYYDDMRKLSKDDLNILSDEKRDWIFFSPTQLLCNYLRSNMQYEGLINPAGKAFVWSKYLKDKMRDSYFIAGNGAPFVFESGKLKGLEIFQKYDKEIISDFASFYVQQFCDKLTEIANMDFKSFKWSIIGKVIASICKRAKAVTTIEKFLPLLFALEELRSQKLPNSALTINSIVKEYNQEIGAVTNNMMMYINDNASLHDSLTRLAKSWEDVEEDDDITQDADEDINEDEQPQVIEERLRRAVRVLLKRLALRQIEKNATLTQRSQQLYELLKDHIKIDELTNFGQNVYFIQHIYPFVRGFESVLFPKITQIYKNYRKSKLRLVDDRWNLETLKLVVNDERYPNRTLYQQEQALLLGFINNLIVRIRKSSVGRFDSLKHKYATAYKDLCRPIIGVDEASDYTVFDYYGISSLQHYQISCVTLTGDLMQSLRKNGITSWKEIEDERIFSKVDVCELKTSYRQSPELIKLADFLYQKKIHKAAPYKCSMRARKSIPRPLWFSSDSEEDKANWIVNRILEVKKAYGQMPSIAVFSPDGSKISKLRSDMLDNGELDSAGISVVDCSNGITDAEKENVRIFPLNLVKGMEFDVVFFHDINNIQDLSMIDKYLYVGLSRAAFYLAVTLDKEIPENIRDIQGLFETEADWRYTGK